MPKESLPKARRRALRGMAPHLRRVGEIASLWSQLELHLDAIIWNLLRTKRHLAACVTSQIPNAPAKLRSIKALVDLDNRLGMHDALKSRLNKFGGDLEAVSRKRNRAVHDSWHLGSKARVYQRQATVRENKLLFQDQPVRVRELDRTSAQIRGLLKRVYMFDRQIGSFIQSSHKHVMSAIPEGKAPRKRRSRA